MKIMLTILMLFGFSSCILWNKNETSTSSAEMKIYNEWLYALKLQDLKVNGQMVTRPPGISQLLFRLTIPSEGGLTVKTHCVYYQVPYKKIPGSISIEELKSDASCEEVGSGEPWLEIKNVKDLTVSLSNFKLALDFKVNDQKISWKFLLPNIEDGLIHEKYQPVKEKKLYPGMSFLRINEESFENQNNKYLGKLSDRFGRGSSIRCMQVDKNCQNVGEDRCDECRYGWYQVEDYRCPQGGSKFCGQNHCGEKNEPACPRGTKVVDEKESGICQSDLTAVWNADHILVCQ